MAAAGAEEGFMCSIGPGSFARGEDLYYKTEEEFVFAAAEAMREEYKAIVDAGIVLQIDDPSLPDNWDMINPEPPLAEFKKFERVRIDALNHALRGLPPDRIRFHICWGSWHGPHTTDIPLPDIVDLVLRVNAGAYSVEAGNPRHEHEWRVWKEVKLPRRQAAHSRRGQPRHQHRGASAGGRRPHRALRQASSAGRMSSPAPIAALAAASIRRSRGQSCRRWPRRKLASSELWQ